MRTLKRAVISRHAEVPRNGPAIVRASVYNGRSPHGTGSASLSARYPFYLQDSEAERMKTTIGWIAALLAFPLLVIVALSPNRMAVDLAIANISVRPLLMVGYSVAVGVLTGIAVSIPAKPKMKHTYGIPR